MCFVHHISALSAVARLGEEFIFIVCLAELLGYIVICFLAIDFPISFYLYVLCLSDVMSIAVLLSGLFRNILKCLYTRNFFVSYIVFTELVDF